MTAAAILEQFPKLAALVVGDICLDRWCRYDPDEAEPSRETGIARVAVVATETTAGAGGTVANNLAALGAGRVAVLGAVGRDGHAFELRQALAARGIAHELLVDSPGLLTFTYTKLIQLGSDEEDLPRIDFVNTRPLPSEAEREILSRFEDQAPAFDVVIVSDQAETTQGGVVTPALRYTLSQFALKYPQKVVWVDSRMRAELFRDVLVKPNEREAEEACLRLLGRVDFGALRRAIGGRPLIVTHGSKGAEVIDDSSAEWAPAVAVANPVDICGAGDSFTAGASLAYKVTGSAITAARFGNLVASITIMKRGTGTASPAEVRRTEAAL